MKLNGVLMHQDSKEPIGRFAIKLSIAALIAGILKRNNYVFEHQNYLFVFSFWVFAYAAFAVLYAILKKERFTRDHLNYWDEAMWLGAVAAILQVVSHVV